MNTVQLTVCQSGMYVKNSSQLCNVPIKRQLQSKINIPVMKSQSLQATPSFGLQCLPLLKPQKLLPVCLAGGKGMMDNEGSPWKALEKAMNKLKGESIEDVLREQIETGEYSGDGGSGGKKPGGGGGGSGGSEEGNFKDMLDEIIQGFLATFALILVYLYIIKGEEVISLAKDCIRFLFTGYKAERVKLIGYFFQVMFQAMTRKKEEDDDPYWLEKTILSTKTRWDSPAKYRVNRASMRSEDSDESFF